MKKAAAVLFLCGIAFYGFGQDVNKLISQDDVERGIKTLSADDMPGNCASTLPPGIEKGRPVY